MAVETMALLGSWQPLCFEIVRVRPTEGGVFDAKVAGAVENGLFQSVAPGNNPLRRRAGCQGQPGCGISVRTSALQIHLKISSVGEVTQSGSGINSKRRGGYLTI
jgi:hypothetical protein